MNKNVIDFEKYINTNVYQRIFIREDKDII